MENWNIGTFINFFKEQGEGVELFNSDETDQALFTNDYVEYLLFQKDNGVWILQCINIELRRELIYSVPLPKSNKKLLELLTLLEENHA